MKTNLSVSLSGIIAFTASAFADTPIAPSKSVVPVQEEFYRAGEFQGSVSFLGAAQSGGDVPIGIGAPIGFGGPNRFGGPIGLGRPNGPAGPNGFGGPNGLGGQSPIWTNDTAGGVDVELKYFITRNFGIGLDGEWLATSRALFGSALNFYLRAPLSHGSRWAPYLFAGAGGLYGGGDAFLEGHLGAGLEYRFTPKFGVFGDGRYEWVDASGNTVPQFGAMRLGFIVVF